MRYVRAKLKEKQSTLAYRIYIADTLYFQGEKKRLTERLIDILQPERKDTRSGDEIALDVIKKLGLKVKT